MMGSKERHFAPLINVSVEELVPQDHFYRHLERTLDLSFVREFKWTAAISHISSVAYILSSSSSPPCKRVNGKRLRFSSHSFAPRISNA